MLIKDDPGLMHEETVATDNSMPGTLNSVVRPGDQ